MSRGARMHKANQTRRCYTVSVMARRPDPAEFDRPLNRAELAELQRRLSMLSPHQVADAYRKAHEACRMDGDGLPRASAVQEMVTARRVLWGWGWRVWWGWRRKGPVERG